MTDRKPFGVELIREFCPSVVYPPKIAKKRLEWGFRLNAVDLTSQHEFRWPPPGNWAMATGPFTDSSDPCPSRAGDGICAARTLFGAQSSGRGLSSSVGLLVAWLPEDVLALSSEKVRVKRAWVADLFDPMKVALGADLSGANLSGADLYGADLSRANLSRANLSRADLSRANLSRANLYGAYLYGADLSGADLSGADLSGAHLYGANLSRAHLYGAYLYGANLSRADLYGANLSRADLYGADLSRANLSGADLSGASHDQMTLWPAGFNPTGSGAIK